jgi:hypothetical protein
MTEEERFSTIKITKKTKNADSSPTYAPLRGGGLLGKKDKEMPYSGILFYCHPFFIGPSRHIYGSK